MELALCIEEMILLKYFSLEYLNRNISMLISKNFVGKRTIGGNGHENSTLLRLLPLMIGITVPDGDGAWTVLINLKEILELVLSPMFDDESIQYLQTKIQDQRQTLQEVFPEFRLLLKHHYIEHYPDP